ncbi:MAG: histidine kinase [Ferruginibacter sp.]
MATNIYSGQKRKFIFFTVFTAWWSLWILVHIIVLNDFGLSLSRAAVDSAVSNVLMAVICLLVINNMRYYLPRNEKYLYVLIISFALSGLWLLLMRLSLWGLYKHDVDYMQLLSKTSYLRYAISFLMMGVITMLSLLWFTQNDKEEDDRRKQDTERLAREAELNKLRQQLQPHFLFNSLNSISALTGTQPEKARHMIQQLSDFLRGTLKKEAQQNTSFEEELQYLQLYLDIEKVRFGYRLQTNIQYDEEALQMKLPALLLQPIVENAIKFGLYDTIGEVAILIAAKNNNGMLEVTVENPFDESSSMPVKGTGFGLSSIRRRLFLLFGRQDLLQVKKESEKFITIITIPQST